MAQVSINFPTREDKHLKKYCEITGRTQTDVLRELVRGLKVKGELEPLDR
jgi:predicted DNA-binding protein